MSTGIEITLTYEGEPLTVEYEIVPTINDTYNQKGEHEQKEGTSPKAIAINGLPIHWFNIIEEIERLIVI